MELHQNSHMQERNDQFVTLLNRFSEEYKPLLLCLVERQAAARLRNWAVDADDAVCQRVMITCAEQKEEVARRVEALFPDARDIEDQICMEIPEVARFDRELSQNDSLKKRLVMQVSDDRLNARVFQKMAGEERREQARHTLLSCVVLEQKNADCLESVFVDN